MDESLFRTFLEEEQTILADFDALLRQIHSSVTEMPNRFPHNTALGAGEPLAPNKDSQVRFGDSCRRLAEAYLICDSRQRAVIRELIRELRGVCAEMGVSEDQIRTRIDDDRFRLGLIFESIKDWSPNVKEAARRLERLRLVAIEAGIDPNPHLREIAEISSDIRHSDR